MPMAFMHAHGTQHAFRLAMGDQRRRGSCGTSIPWSSGCAFVAMAQCGWLASLLALPWTVWSALLLPLAFAFETVSVHVRQNRDGDAQPARDDPPATCLYTIRALLNLIVQEASVGIVCGCAVW